MVDRDKLILSFADKLYSRYVPVGKVDNYQIENLAREAYRQADIFIDEIEKISYRGDGI